MSQPNKKRQKKEDVTFVRLPIHEVDGEQVIEGLSLYDMLREPRKVQEMILDILFFLFHSLVCFDF